MEAVIREVLKPLFCCFPSESQDIKVAPHRESPLSKSTLRSSPSTVLEKGEVSGIALLEDLSRVESQKKLKRRPKVFPIRGNRKTLVYYRAKETETALLRKSRTTSITAQSKELGRGSVSSEHAN